jgi:GDP-4-dehydro-6-deoxy-D-mannose reductase
MFLKVLILGITGFAGTHLYNFLTNHNNVDIYGTFRHSSKGKNSIERFKNATLLECDINDIHSVEKVLGENLPDIIFHFTAYVSVHSSFKNPRLAFQTNIMGTINLLESLKKISPGSKVLIPGSAEVYGIVPKDKMPIKEDYVLNPVSPYAISKKVQEEIGLYYCRMYNLNIFFTRTFHYTGPEQPLGFVCSDFAKQIVDIENNRIKNIKVGNLEAKRDFTDIRDVANAYWEIVNKGEAGKVYNVCRGQSISIKEILDKLVNFSEGNIVIEIDINKLRPSDVPDFVGDNTNLKQLGWVPRYSLNDSLNTLLEGWRKGN